VTIRAVPRDPRSCSGVTNVEIRHAGPADGDALFPLLQGFAMSYPSDRAAFDAHLPRLVEAEHAEVWVACADEQVIGYLVAFHLLTLFANGVVTEVQELMVDPGWRGQGVGGRLVKTVIQSARARGSAEVTVPTRRAEAFYESLGFERTASYLKLELASSP
jgi:N-acetylglutamate synthase-like GNAT family acetyltransferase